MEFKRFLMGRLTLFFILSTLITVAVSLLGSAFDPEALLRYQDLLTPLKYAGLCLLPTLVTWSRRELSLRQLLVRKALMLALLEGEILAIAFHSPAIDTQRPSVIITLAGSVLVIFVLANLFLWLKDFVKAKRLNRELSAFQRLHEALQ